MTRRRNACPCPQIVGDPEIGINFKTQCTFDGAGFPISICQRQSMTYAPAGRPWSQTRATADMFAFLNTTVFMFGWKFFARCAPRFCCFGIRVFIVPQRTRVQCALPRTGQLTVGAIAHGPVAAIHLVPSGACYHGYLAMDASSPAAPPPLPPPAYRMTRQSGDSKEIAKPTSPTMSGDLLTVTQPPTTPPTE